MAAGWDQGGEKALGVKQLLLGCVKQQMFPYNNSMRNYSRQVPATYYKYQSVGRNYTQEKRLQQLHTLKETEVKVGIYKYSTQDELGKGYSSRVYKGVEIEKLHKRYAIKVIELKKFRGSNLEMLEAEIDIHRHLLHENVLRLHEVIKTPYFYYLILEYCPHGNLHEYIKQKKKLSEGNAAEIMEQVLAGYRYLIEEGVIHRDLKPANILRIGNKWKISDFGFAVKSKYGFKDRINVGTPLYMSPESLRKSYYSCKTDIFALGVVLYEMVEGATPWESSNEKELLEKIKTEIAVPEHIRSAVIRDFIFRACQLNENKRMAKEELQEYQIRPPPTASEIKNEKASERSSAIAMSSNGNSRAYSRKQSFTAQPAPPRPVEDFIKNNTDILSNEFSLVRHIYSCLKNIDSFLVDAQNRQIFTLTLFKLLLRLVRFLCDKKENHYNLKNWLDYITSPAYNDLYQEMIGYSQVLEKEYLEYIKHNDIKVIRSVNRKFPDLCHNAPISEKFYLTLKAYLTIIIRQHNHELMQLQTAQDQQSQQSIGQPHKNTIKQSQVQAESVKKSSPQSIKLQHDEKEEKNNTNGSSGPRKIYESKRSLRRVSQIKIDDPEFLPQQPSPLKAQQEAKQHNQQLQEISAVQPSVLMNHSQISGHQQERALITATQLSKRQQITQNSEAKINSQTSIAPPHHPKINDKIQALQSLYTIYRTAELRSHPEQRQIGQKLRVITHYSESTLDKRDYLDLRRLLRSM